MVNLNLLFVKQLIHVVNETIDSFLNHVSNGVIVGCPAVNSSYIFMVFVSLVRDG
jgi:hypothetical protein